MYTDEEIERLIVTAIQSCSVRAGEKAESEEDILAYCKGGDDEGWQTVKEVVREVLVLTNR